MASVDSRSTIHLAVHRFEARHVGSRAVAAVAVLISDPDILIAKAATVEGVARSNRRQGKTPAHGLQARLRRGYHDLPPLSTLIFSISVATTRRRRSRVGP
jgi:hypothetical protein